MKTLVTKKSMKGYDKIASIGYCNAQNLLRYQEPISYSAGSYGWDCDYYRINDVLICTGYRTINSKNTKCDYETVSYYDYEARKILSNYDLKWEEQRDAINNLLNEFITKISI